MPPPQRALVRSQGGPLSSVCCPTSRLTKFSSQSFRVLLLRRLHLLVSSRNCRCGRPLDCIGHHRSACAVAGVLGRRWFAVESAIARICREGGARVSTNVFVRDLDLGAFNHLDSRRLEVCQDGLSLYGGAELAIDTNLVSALRRDGPAREGAANRNGVAIRSAHRRKRCRGSCSVGHPCWRGWRPLVARDCELLAGSGSCEGSGLCSAVGRTSSHVQQRALSLLLCWK